MTIRRFVVFGDHRRAGVWLDDKIADIEALIDHYWQDVSPSIAPAPGWRPDGTLLNIIDGGDEALACIDLAIESGVMMDMALDAATDVILHPPVVPGARIACVGGNFVAHMAAMAVRVSGNASPSTPDETRERIRSSGIWGFWKISEPVGDGASVRYPDRAERLDFEGELAVVLGRGGRDIPQERANEAIWGITLLNDLSIRAPRDPEAIYKFALGKNFDGSCPVGPCVVAGADIASLRIRTRVNGVLRQDFAPADMVISYADFIAWLSRDHTLRAGDMVSGGTGAGTAADSSPIGEADSFPPDLFLKEGDVVEIECDPIGVLRTTLIGKTAQPE